VTLLFKRNKHEAGDIYSFFFEPQTPVSFTAGQSIKIALPAELDALERRFSISSAPGEDAIRITTRMTNSDFKQALNHLHPGDKVQGFAIEGDFTWRDSPLPKVFVAAGIGVTPYRAMLAQRDADNQPLDITLIYGSSDHLLFKDELDAWQQTHPEFRVIYQVGQRLDGAFISQHCDARNSLLYVSGPTQMVDELNESLQHHGAKEENIVLDWFTGKLHYY
jgi:ferredoxin-NADP reductase